MTMCCCVLLCVVGSVMGVTQLGDVVYVVCAGSSTIRRYSATTHERLSDISIKDLRSPWDIAACEQTSQLYVADSLECIWRVSVDGEDIKRWWSQSPSDIFAPYTLSVTSSRVLVTSQRDILVTSPGNNQLMQLDSAGDELRRVGLPYYMEPQHAVESPTGTFIISHSNTQLEQRQDQVSEVNTEGQVLRQFSGSLGFTPHIAVDSHGNIFVADEDNRRILLLDSKLALRRVIIDQHQLNDQRPRRLCYNEQSGRLTVALQNSSGVIIISRSVAVFDVLQR